METYTYDDGSTLTTGWDGTVTSTPATDQGVGGWSQDQAEAAKFQQFYGNDKPWYEQLALYGATRAIDSHYQRAEVNKTVQPATFAGQNGQTYAAGTTAPSLLSGQNGLILLAAAAVAAVILLR